MNQRSPQHDYRTLMQNALRELQQMRAKLATLEQNKTEPIAIIGIGCRFPGGADTPAAFWQLLQNGVDAIAEVPPNRWHLDSYFDPNPEAPGKIYTRYGGFIDNLETFDTEFFGIAPREALSLDPQQRLLLEVSWEALENAGIVPKNLSGSKTGVFVGISSNDYSHHLLTREPDEIDAYLATGNSHSTAAGRLSYTYGFVGPSFAVDTACSSSLVAVHLACQSLRNQECDLAVVGGVNRLFAPEFTINFAKARMLAADGRCKTFDAAADGFVRAEGCGVVILKRLADAIADRDKILALIPASAVNQDGRSSGLTVPNGPAQQSVIVEALRNGNIDPVQISYIEAHGTGTALGDPIEVNALGAIFGKSHTFDQPLRIGSVKTNIGHLEAAAGVAGLIKVILALQNRQIPPHLHYKQPNPHIPWQQLPIQVTTALTPWTGSIAGVSSFGFSGTNAHVIVAEATNSAVEASSHVDTPQILTLSAKTLPALSELTKRYEAYLAANPNVSIADVCFNAQTRRSHFQHRLAIVAQSSREAQEKLKLFNTHQQESTTKHRPKIAFLLTGQGSQYANMGKHLYQTQPIFTQHIDRCCELLQPYLSIDLREVLYPKAECQLNLNDTIFAQPAIFIVEYALYQLWTSWGVYPDVVIGHSIGEYVAATIAEVFSLEDALKLVVTRAQLMQALPPNGKMVAVAANETTVAAIIEDYQQVSIAAINAPENTVISGNINAVDAIVTTLEAQHIAAKTLAVSHAFHSPLMQPMVQKFAQIAREVEYNAPKLNLISNLTGKLAGDEIATPEYWCEHILQPVRFAAGMKVLAELDCNICVEVGAKPTLLGLGRAILANSNILWLPSLKPSDQINPILSSVAQLYVAGVKIDWRSFGCDRPLLALPNYPFQRQRFWVDVAKKSPRIIDNGLHPLLGQRFELARPKTVYFENYLGLNRLSYLQDHQVFDKIIFPGAGYLEMAIAAGNLVLNTNVILENVEISQALVLTETKLQLVLQHNKFEILSLSAATDEWIVHATGKIQSLNEPQNPTFIDIATVQRQCQEINPLLYYQTLRSHGINYGATFQAIAQLWQGENQALAQIQLPPELTDTNYRLHPVLLDAAFQAIGAAVNEELSIYLPVGLEKLVVYKNAPRSLWSYVQVYTTNAPGSLKADVQLIAASGELVATISGLHLRQAQQALDVYRDWYQVEWQSEGRVRWIPSLASVCDRLSPTVQNLVAQPEIQQYQKLLPQLEKLSISYVIDAFTSLGWQFVPNQYFSTSQLVEKLAIAPQYQQLCDRLLEMLAEEHFLRRHDDLWQVVALPQSTAPQLTESVELTLLDRCGKELANLLQGKTEPLQLLFPQGDLTNATQLYQDSPAAKLMNTLVQQVVLALEKPHYRRVRILEIGAGTGGTTAYLLPHLDPAVTEYTFSDVSPRFVHNAQQRFQEYAFVQYRVLDIETPPQAQGFAVDRYDIVIAANVLHATCSLAQSLAHVQQLLVDDGVLILLESTQKLRSLDLIFGLTDGWWRFGDRDLRAKHPLLSVAQWQQLLANCGFVDVAAIAPEPQSILLARKQVFCQWVILCDRLGLGEELARLLAQRGDDCVLVFAEEVDWRRVFEDAERGVRVVYLWGLDGETNHRDAESAEGRSKGGLVGECRCVLELVRGLGDKSAGLWLVTQGAVMDVDRRGIWQSPLWGLGRVIALEHPELGGFCVDLDPAVGVVEQASELCAVLVDSLPQVALRNQQCYVPRLVRYCSSLLEVSEPFRLGMSTKGTLDLQFQPMMRNAPQAGEVEIRVRATGLNFIDVLDALGLLPFERDWFGVECSGEVVAVGDGVEHLQVGDAVIALAPASFAQFVTTNAKWVVLKPHNLSFATAATIPANFLTADYALNHVAKIIRGKRILIHAAAGGTGMAALQLALQAGAEVFATASPSKWQQLQAMGVKHVFNSRNIDFAAEIMVLTDGEGVDVVFNSLSGDFIAKSLSVLKPDGHFLEIGKRDIWSQTQVQQVNPGATYTLIDLMSVAQQQPDRMQSMLRHLVSLFATSQLQVSPQTVFPIEKVVDAFRYMQQAKHIGKIIITHYPLPLTSFPGTYIITGGLGGLGLLIANWLVEQGARHLVLVSRREADAEIIQRIEMLKSAGAEILVISADVTDESQVSGVLSTIKSSLPPLRGVIHAAGVLDDGVMQQMTWERFAKVLYPKMLGAWHLHTLTQDQPLDFFVLFSSAASLLGSPGQANHVAANTFLDALAHYRQAQGLPGLSINWGAWSVVGAAAKRGVAQQMRSRGIHEISPQQGLQSFAALLRQTAAQVGVVPIDWSTFLQHTNSDFFADFQTATQPKSPPQSVKVERPQQLKAYLQTEVAQVLGLPISQLPALKQGFFELGMDSLMTVELKNRLETNLGVSIPASAIFEYPTIEDLAGYLAEKLANNSDTNLQPKTEDNDDPNLTNADIISELAELETLLQGQTDESN
ncbi:polyketide synthase (plasmid) [Gloeocapsa sp. PCC 7428]|uniref:type I polyketide synthase n=1 Tax=Gloeocapsa sp. PCC 7428 TaxID=1173026 RepID=UPI0002A61635|nr:type I polyketide synthase [Gloeocapsa sp. PCC 7428]AFZ33410.1 polyketide synthase [Gloeocapsa sp. PCC 7428]